MENNHLVYNYMVVSCSWLSLQKLFVNVLLTMTMFAFIDNYGNCCFDSSCMSGSV